MTPSEITGGPIIFPFQIVDATILCEEWDVLKVLVPGANEEQIEKVQMEYEQAQTGPHKQHLEDVLRTAFESNKGTFRKMKEAGKMSEAVEFVFKEEINKVAEKKEEQVVTAMLQNNEPADKIVKYFGWTPEKVMTFAKKIGVTTLTL